MANIFRYPFLRTPLSSSEETFVAHLLAEVEGEYQLFVDRPSLVPLCRVFLRHCSPPAPSQRALEVVTRFLHLVMYFADRVSPATVEQDAATFLACLAGKPSSARGPVTAAARALADRAWAVWRESGADPAGFLQLLRINLGTFVWAASPARPREDLASHLTFRTESICAKAYLRLWGLLLGLSPAHELRYAFLFQEAEDWSARVQALANDLRSVARDEREGTPNTVALLMGERALSRAAAEAHAHELHEDALRALIACLGRARASERAGEEPVARYLDFIGICTQGNDSSMLDLTQRYDVTTSEPV